MTILALLEAIANRCGGLTIGDAKRLCGAIPDTWYTRRCGPGETSEPDFANHLKHLFPDFNWRIILDRSGERTRWALTIDDNDPREHYVPTRGVCVHCGKTAPELGVEERDD